MARAKLKIENQQDASLAYTWIKNQFKNNLNFPDENTCVAVKSEGEFKNIGWRDYEGINTWCETFLKKEQWKKIKNAIRAGRLRLERLRGNAGNIVRIDINHKSYYMLKRLAKHHGVTLSEVIIKYTEKAFMELPEDEEG